MFWILNLRFCHGKTNQKVRDASKQSSTYWQEFDRKPKNHGHVETLNFEKPQKHRYIGQCLKFADKQTCNRERVDEIEQSTINFIQLHR